ncbi:MAG: ADP-ribosylglycohydrolase family protein [Acidobacteria bacterium]|nr:ADP-ribosylglycohydrolase family protein [Acidobacteriota bacterium]
MTRSAKPGGARAQPETPRTLLHDKVLGSLVGSAIGDAMGAPTEMWSRDQIQAEYGFVRDLHTAVRPPSPEGTWTMNVPAGATTDDTRWKALMVDYLTGTGTRIEAADQTLKPKELARLISARFSDEIERLRTLSADDPATQLANGLMRVQWLQEWERVARAYLAGGEDEHRRALDQFYGGEMVCAGLLFSPTLGAFYPGDPEAAYLNAFAVDIYDLGYARDVSAVTAAMVAAAMAPDATPDSVLAVVADVDPHGYFETRLVGRLAHEMLRDARSIVHAARKVEGAPAETPGTLESAGQDHPWASSGLSPRERSRLEAAYRMLDARRQRMPFHAGEIHLVNLTALLYSDFDFPTALTFVVNWGRDNDTTAAVTGALLGAFVGAEKLPRKWVGQSLERNRGLGIDLEALADRMTTAILSR